MAGRIAYYGGIVTNGLVLDLDAAKRDSYPGFGTTWNDISGNRNNGTLTNGPTFNSGNGGSIVFDGVNDYSGSPSINTGQNITVSAWIYPTILGTTRRAVVANSYDFASSRNGWNLSTAGADTNNTFFFSVGQDNAYRVAAANTLSPNTWAYILVICANGGGNIVLYKNGVAISSYVAQLLSSGTMTYTANQLNIGYRYSNQTDPYTGNIANVQIYNRVLSDTEILQNYNATKGRYGL
jgi:hypothetical protein